MFCLLTKPTLFIFFFLFTTPNPLAKVVRTLFLLFFVVFFLDFSMYTCKLSGSISFHLQEPQQQQQKMKKMLYVHQSF